ncbi:MAG: DUF362 domain-containing protein [Candidatus Omnitrophota bacterium]
MSSEVSIVKCADYSSPCAEQAIRRAIDLLGGIDKFVKPRSRVLVKPNLLAAREPESGIVTHPEIVRAIIHLLKEIEVQVYLGDSPNASIDDAQEIDSVWEKSGIKQVAREEGVELVRFNQSRWHKRFPLTTWLNELDYFISLPKFKTHDLTILTGAIKNLFGLIPGKYKIELHKNFSTPLNFSRMLVDLYEIAKPTLTIVDGVLALEGEGPGSKAEKRNLGLIVAGVDCVSVDSILALIMGLNPEDILTTKEAAARNLGNARVKDIRILGGELSSFISRPFKLPKTSFKYSIPAFIVKSVGKLIRFYPVIDLNLCLRCNACVRICPEKVIKEKDGDMIIDYPGCIACFCCQEVCLCAAISISKSILAKLLRL